MNKEGNALKAGVGYTIGNILVKGINFLTLPIFSRLLTTAEFGVYNIFIAYDAILIVLVGLALNASVKSAHYEFKKTDEYVSSISLIYIICALIYLAIILIGGQQLCSWLGFSQTVLLLLIPYSFAGAVFHLYNERISLDYDYKKYLTVAFLNSVGNVVISLILILTVFRNQRDVGRIVGTVATMFVIAFFLLIKMYLKEPPKINLKFWKFGILYSLPIIPHGISQVLLAQCDRIMISNFISDSAAGVYSLAGNIKLALTIVSTSIGTSWSTWFFAQMAKCKIEEIQKNASLLVRLFTILSLSLMALSPEIISLLGGKEYEMGKYVALPIIMDAFILFLYNIIVTSEYYKQKTQYIMLGTIGATIINIVTNYIFIKKYGFIAAAYTTLFSYVCYLLMHYFISKRLVGFDIVKHKAIILFSGIIIVAGLVDLLYIDNIFVRFALCAVFTITLCPPLIKYYLATKKNR